MNRKSKTFLSLGGSQAPFNTAKAVQQKKTTGAF
jgi:hypothetical protein